VRTLLAAALLVAFGADPAQACHRFSVWKYPQPQRCKVTHVALQAVSPADLRHLPAPAPWIVDESHSPGLTPDDEDAARARALEALKAMLAEGRK
jgi:hypothetical protein